MVFIIIIILILFLFFFFFGSVLRPFQDYFNSETGQSVGGAKMGECRGKTSCTPQPELGLSHMYTSAGLEPTPDM